MASWRNKLEESFKKNKTLISNFSYLSILEALSLILPLICYPYLIRVLGANLYGIVIIAQAVAAYLTIIVNFGFNISATKRISENRNNPQELSKIFSSVIYLKCLLCLIVSIFFIFSLYITNPEYKIVYILSFGLVIQEIFFPIWFFQGIEKMKYITYITLFFRSFFLICIFIFVRSESDYYYIPLINLLGSIIISFIALFIVIKKFQLSFVKSSTENLKFTFYESVPFFASRFSSVIMEKSNIILIGVFLNPSMVSTYDFASKVINTLKIPFLIIAQVLYPNISLSKDRILLKKTYRLVIIIGISLSILVILSSQHIVLTLVGQELSEAIDILQLMSLYLPIVAASYILGASTLVVFNHIKEYNLSLIYALITYVIIVLFLILLNRLNCYTTIVAYIVPELFVAVYRRWIAKKNKIF